MDKIAENKKHTVLLAASISREWDIAALPERMKNSDYVFEYVHGGGTKGCGLCKLYNKSTDEVSCSGCPIQEKTGRKG